MDRRSACSTTFKRSLENLLYDPEILSVKAEMAPDVNEHAVLSTAIEREEPLRQP